MTESKASSLQKLWASSWLENATCDLDMKPIHHEPFVSQYEMQKPRRFPASRASFDLRFTYIRMKPLMQAANGTHIPLKSQRVSLLPPFHSMDLQSGFSFMTYWGLGHFPSLRHHGLAAFCLYETWGCRLFHERVRIMFTVYILSDTACTWGSPALPVTISGQLCS